MTLHALGFPWYVGPPSSPCSCWGPPSRWQAPYAGGRGTAPPGTGAATPTTASSARASGTIGDRAPRSGLSSARGASPAAGPVRAPSRSASRARSRRSDPHAEDATFTAARGASRRGPTGGPATAPAPPTTARPSPSAPAASGGSREARPLSPAPDATGKPRRRRRDDARVGPPDRRRNRQPARPGRRGRNFVSTRKSLQVIRLTDGRCDPSTENERRRLAYVFTRFSQCPGRRFAWATARILVSAPSSMNTSA